MSDQPEDELGYDAGDELDAEIVEQGKREIVKIDKGPEFGVALYQGAAMLKITPEEAAILEAPRDEEAELDILPTGEVYMPQIHYRRCLSKAFGAGQWALIPRGGYIQEGNTLSREFALYVRGHYVSEAVGEQEWFPCKEDDSRQSMTKATAAESLKSNALMRVCKDLGIASECWDKRFTERFKAKYCVQVWCNGKNKPQWRRKDAAPFWNEKGQAESRAPQSDPPSRPAPQAERQRYYADRHEPLDHNRERDLAANTAQPASKGEAAPAQPVPDVWVDDKIPNGAMPITDRIVKMERKKRDGKADFFKVELANFGDGELCTLWSLTGARVANKAMESKATCDFQISSKPSGKWNNYTIHEIVIRQADAPGDDSTPAPEPETKPDDLPF